MVHNVVDDVTNTGLGRVAGDGRLKLNLIVHQADLDVKDWCKAVKFVVLNRDLLSQVKHTRVDAVSDSFDNKAIHVVHVCKPQRALLIGLDVVDRILHEFRNFFALSSNVFKTARYGSIVKLLDIIRWVWLHLPLVEGLLPLIHHLNHFADIQFHLLDEFIDFGNNVHSIFDKFIDVVGVPLEFIHSWLQVLVDGTDSLLHQWLLDWKQGSDDVVVHVDYQVQVSCLCPVDINFVEEAGSSLGHLDIQQLQVLDFPEEGSQNRVEVDTHEAFWCIIGLFSYK